MTSSLDLIVDKYIAWSSNAGGYILVVSPEDFKKALQDNITELMLENLTEMWKARQ